MSITQLPPSEHPAFAALRALDVELDRLVVANLWSLSDTELLELRAQEERLHSRLTSARLSATQEVHARGAATKVGAASTAAWLANVLHEHPGDAGREVQLAAALHDRLPATASALGAGVITAAAVEVITQSDTELAAYATAAQRAEAEALLTEHAPRLPIRGLQRAAVHLRHHLDTDQDRKTERAEQVARERSELHMSPLSDGTWRLSGRLDPEGGQMMRAALDPLAKPQPGPAGVRDERSPARRRADALVELAELALRSGCLPQQAGQPVQVIVTIGLEDLQRRLAGAGGITPGMFDDGTPISAAAVRRLACDCQLIPVVLNAKGEPLDVGRGSRSFPPAQRRALVVRDGGCIFPGCDRPPRWAQGHHIWEWDDGGPTSVSNGVLLCARHHRAIHHEGWEVRIEIDGLSSFYPPAWIDPGRRPRRHHRHPPHPSGPSGIGPPPDRPNDPEHLASVSPILRS